MKNKELRKEMKDVKKHLSLLEEETQDIFSRQHELQERLLQIRKLIVEQEKLLSASPWKVEINDRKEIILRADARDFKELVNICTSNWTYVDVKLEGGGFHEHDGYMVVTFKSNKEVLPFIERYGIKLDLTDINEQKETLRDGLDSINKVLRSVNIIEKKNSTR